jgi:FkbM family methyltransferase
MFYVGDKVRANVLIPCDQGTFIINRFDYVTDESGEKVGQGQWLLDHGNVSTVESSITIENLKNIDSPVVFDVGANIGTYCSWISKLIPDSKVYVFEPQRLVFQMLCGNMAINNFENVYPYNMALSDENKMIVFDEPDYKKTNNFGSFSLVNKDIIETTNSSSIVECLKLDTFVDKYQIEKIDFIKIDVEGMELEVLRGAKETINKFKPCFLIEHKNNWSNFEKEIIEELSSYDCYKFESDENNILVTKYA